MMYSILKTLNRIRNFPEARAHCDIPCGIYDPITAQIAALTVIRMIDLMAQYTKDHPEQNLEFHNTMSRYVAVKEEHAEKCKHEVRIIWGDYMKDEHVQQHADLHQLVQKIMKSGSKARQSADRAVAEDLLKSVNRFAEIFWQTKGVATKRAKAPYNPPEELVYPAL